MLKEVNENMVDEKGRMYAVIANVMEIKDDNACYQTYCRECKRQLTEEFCEECGEEKGITAVYKFTIKVSDNTGILYAKVTNEQGEILLGMPAEELKEMNDADSMAYTSILEYTRDQVLFIIKSSHMECY